jgi:hypothetical protein
MSMAFANQHLAPQFIAKLFLQDTHENEKNAGS